MAELNDNLVSAYELADHYGVSNTIIYRLIAAGKIETIKIGKTKYIDKSIYGSKFSFNEKKTGKRD